MSTISQNDALLDVGSQCAVDDCDTVDFLPVTCACSRVFCGQHGQPDKHHCPTLRFADAPKDFEDKIERCSMEGCQNAALPGSTTDGMTCSACQKAFCAIHRFQDTHACPAFIAAQAPTSQTSKPTRTQTTSTFKSFQASRKGKPSAQTKKVEAMKMRHQAIPADPKDKTSAPPLEQRVLAKVIYDGGEKIFWFRKTIIVGRAVDLLSSQLSVGAATALRKDDDSEALDNSKEIGDQVTDGDTLCLFEAS